MSTETIIIIAVVAVVLIIVLVKHHKTVKRREEDAHDPAPDKHAAPKAPEAPAPMEESPEIAEAAKDEGPIVLE